MKKVSLFLKKLILSVLIGASMLSVISVNASAPSSIKMASKSSMYYFSGSTAYISGYKFYQKKLSNGTLAYCASTIKSSVPGGKTLSLKGEADAGLTYIINNGYPNKSFMGDAKKDYYLTQAAIWEYFDRTRGQSNWHSTSFEGAKAGTMKYYVNQLATGAVNALKNGLDTSKPTVTLSVPSNQFTLNGSYYVSQLVTVNLTKSDGTYTVTLSGATGAIAKDESGNTKTTFKQGEKFRVYVPSTSAIQTVTAKVKTTRTISKVYEYTTGSSSYQNIIPVVPYPEVLTAEASVNFTYTKTKLSISKQDITTKKELPGATLVLKNANGTVVDTWVSKNTPHYIEGLPTGKYTLTETIAPNGYVLSTETITFELTNDGVVKTVVMYNQMHDLTKIKVSKQDITTKKELPGATLVVKDSTGKVIDTWVSTNEPHYVEGLKAGKYTLTETIAPEGYVLSTETIEFEVKHDGSVKTVIMYNQMNDLTKIKVSKQDITTKKELPGATLVVKDSTGKVIDTWVSTNEPHYVEGLKAGKYTLTETIAPEGYVLSTETIEFEVKHDGSVKTVVMYNELIPTKTKVKISKQDITTKKELPGATLQIKDASGTVIETWVSTNEPHYIEGLEPGIYTLTETIAPEGYELSTETIEFELKNDGSIKTVIMYNTPYVDVPSTALNASSIVIIVGLILSLFGMGMVFKNVNGKE